ncbi:MAG: GFA family protein [Aliidongia sp.]
MVERTARCSCGALTIKATDEPIRISACHCDSCKRRTGSAFSVAVFYRIDRTIAGGPSSRYVRTGDSGSPIEFHFCATCGSTVFWYPDFRPEWVGIAIGCFDDRTLRPAQEVYEQDRLDWVTIAPARPDTPS